MRDIDRAHVRTRQRAESRLELIEPLRGHRIASQCQIVRKCAPRIDEYAAESDSEFFAVTSEYFFEQPRVLRSEYPDVYRLLSDLYRQQPAERVQRTSPAGSSR